MPIPLIGAALGVAGSIGKMIGRGKANKKMKRLLGEDPVYSENPIARQRMGLAQTMLNARMPGAQAVENNIYGNQANTLSNIQRGATDSSQALAMASGVQGSTNDAFQNLGITEAQDYQRRYGNLSDAQEGVIREGDKVFQDKTRRFGNKMQVNGAINENRQNNWGDISNMGFGLADFAMNGGFNSLQGGGSPSLGKMGMPQVGGYPNQSGTVAGAYNPMAMRNMSFMGMPQQGNYRTPRYNPSTGQME
jgi:hypothetical protein